MLAVVTTSAGIQQPFASRESFQARLGNEPYRVSYQPRQLFSNDQLLSFFFVKHVLLAGELYGFYSCLTLSQI